MHRFHLPPERCRGSTLTLTEGEAHHATRVLRVQPGEHVTVLDGVGGEFLCEVGAVTKREVTLRVTERKTHPAPSCPITLLLAIPKGKIIESVIEKATELGAHRIVPLLTERVTTRLNEESAADKAAKWQLVAVEAIKQCGAAWLPKVEAPVTLPDYLTRGERFDLALVGELQGEARHPRECFREYEMQHNTHPSSLAVWIGPEGDFTKEELAAIQATGAKPITLGPLVLRVETAAIYCLSFLNYELRSM
jgi:16S rRNA (uracil1498-N3)-methyltransferase